MQFIKNISAVILFLIAAQVISAQPNQDHLLAQQYYQNGEYDKAAELYSSLFDQNSSSGYYYQQYLYCLLAIENFDDAHKVVKKQIKKNDKQLNYLVDLGFVYQKQNKPDDAEDQFADAIKDLPAEENMIRTVANSFVTYQLYPFAIETYREGNKLLRDDYKFSFELAGLYEQANDVKNAISSYLDYMNQRPETEQGVKNQLARSLEKSLFVAELKSQLYERIQKDESNILYAELLIWVFIQKKDFAAAFIQIKALDKRLKENGYRVMDLARAASSEGFFDDAIAAYDYVIKKGNDSPYFLAAKQEQLNALKSKITLTTEFTSDDILELKAQFEDFLITFGKNKQTARTMRDLANLNAFYLNDLNTADTLLMQIIKLPGVDKSFIAECKLDLGDCFLMQNLIWDATLLYSQVDLDFKDAPIGEMARYKNAKLSYYNGDFEWAQTQLDALKASTTELISNDAINLSVFIIDNLGLDTITRAMLLFAKSDLLIFQNRLDEAAIFLDSINTEFADHALTDDIMMTRARMAEMKRDYTSASLLYAEVMTKFADDLNADDAIFRLAELCETKLNDLERAKLLYEDLVLNHSDSIYSVEASKRYRLLRGDDIEDAEEFMKSP